MAEKEKGAVIPALQLVRHVQGDKGLIKVTDCLAVDRSTTIGELVDTLASQYTLSDLFIIKAVGRYKR
jgi:hypothetical protein